MAKLTIGFSIALILLGVGCYFAIDPDPIRGRSPTALFPAFFGLPMLICGVLAQNPAIRMHAMHGAVLVALIGFLGSLGMVIAKRPDGLKLLDMGGMALLTGLFVVLCVRSFISARKARTASTT